MEEDGGGWRRMDGCDNRGKGSKRHSDNKKYMQVFVSSFLSVEVVTRDTIDTVSYVYA